MRGFLFILCQIREMLTQNHILRIVIPIVGFVAVERCFISLVVAGLAAEFGVCVDKTVGYILSGTSMPNSFIPFLMVKATNWEICRRSSLFCSSASFIIGVSW